MPTPRAGGTQYLSAVDYRSNCRGMTRILLHPQLLPRTGPDGGARVSLTHPWRWWRIKLRPSPGGSMYRMVVDHPTDIAEASILFDLSVDYDIVDPPAMHITEFAPELNHIICG